MTNFETVCLETDGPVAIVTLNRPDALNSFDTALRRDLYDALAVANDDANVRAVVVTGEGRSFCAGADLKDGMSGDVDIESVLQKEYRPVLEIVQDMPVPVIAAIGGSAAGIGVSLALLCDLVVMAEDAFLLAPFTTISLVPDGGLNWLLIRQLGYRRAFQLCIESERVPAERCVELGLANHSVPADELRDYAVRWARKIAERAPLSVAATKRAMRHAASASWASTFDIEAPMQQKLRRSEDCSEGVNAFLEKRKPAFKGR